MAKQVPAGGESRFIGDESEALATLEFLEAQATARLSPTPDPYDEVTVEDAGVATGGSWDPNLWPTMNPVTDDPPGRNTGQDGDPSDEEGAGGGND